MVFFTQITMEAGEDGDYLDAMRRANIKGALVGVEVVTPEGLKRSLQGLELLRRGSGKAATDIQEARRSRPWLIHIWIAHRQACDLRRNGGDGVESGCHVCTVRNGMTPFPGTG